MDEDLIAIEKEIEERKAIVPQTAKNLLADQKEKDFNEIKASKEFQEASLKVNAEKVQTELYKEWLEVQGDKARNELDEYILKKQKEDLDFRQRKMRRIVQQEAKADLKSTKRRIAEQRFGYLYEQDGTYTYRYKNEKGEEIIAEAIKYKDFTPSYSINRIKEFTNWYGNLTENTRKIIWKTVKFFFLGGVGVGLIVLVIEGIKWLAKSGILTNL